MDTLQNRVTQAWELVPKGPHDAKGWAELEKHVEGMVRHLESEIPGFDPVIVRSIRSGLLAAREAAAKRDKDGFVNEMAKVELLSTKRS